jgi:hypothetical protein
VELGEIPAGMGITLLQQSSKTAEIAPHNHTLKKQCFFNTVSLAAECVIGAAISAAENNRILRARLMNSYIVCN